MRTLLKTIALLAPLAAATSASAVEGEVMKINTDTGKMTLRLCVAALGFTSKRCSKDWMKCRTYFRKSQLL